MNLTFEFSSIYSVLVIIESAVFVTEITFLVCDLAASWAFQTEVSRVVHFRPGLKKGSNFSGIGEINFLSSIFLSGVEWFGLSLGNLSSLKKITSTVIMSCTVFLHTSINWHFYLNSKKGITSDSKLAIFKLYFNGFAVLKDLN